MEQQQQQDIVIVGGGLAGLCSAIHLSQSGKAVTVIEKGSYPRHKVCGEYVSNEVLPYLKFLGIYPFGSGAVRIDELDFSIPSGESMHVKLPLGGFSLSRFTFDQILMEKALLSGVKLLNDTVINISYEQDLFKIVTKKDKLLEAIFVIGAYGKRSVLDKKLHRRFIQKPASYVAFKGHYKGAYPKHQVGLYNFEGGYCGVSNIEGEKLNLCYIVDSRVFKKYKRPELFEQEVLLKNNQLKDIFDSSKLIFEKPLSISQISFDTKPLVEDHILMCGDSAGMIHPLCGNGMGMAIGGAQVVSKLILSYFNGEIKTRSELEKIYESTWNKTFKRRLLTGRALAALLRGYKTSYLLMPLLRYFPFLLTGLIKSTHGKPTFAK